MVRVRNSTTSRVEVRQWWVAVKAHQQRFFHLVIFDSLVTMTFRDIDIVIHQLETDYRRLHEAEYPNSASSIRGHLCHAIVHVMDSLWSLKNRELFESDVRFNIAQIDMTMLEHELLELGIMD